MRLAVLRIGIEIGLRRPELKIIKKPRHGGVLEVRLLADLRGITEGDREEQSCNRKGENEDVSEAFHRKTPVERLFEGSSRGGNVTIGKTAGGLIAKFGEETEFNLVAEIGVDTGEHISVQGASTMPDVTEEEEQSECGVAEGEPTPWGAAEHTV